MGFFDRLQSRLLFAFLLASVVPLIAAGWLFFGLVNKTITDETNDMIQLARDAKSSEFMQYLSFARQQASSLAQSSTVRYSVGDFYGFSYALRQLDTNPDVAAMRLRSILLGDNDAISNGVMGRDIEEVLLENALEYANTFRRFHGDYVGFLETAEFDNLYLVNRRGRVVYSVIVDNYFGRVLTDENTPLGEAYSALRSLQVSDSEGTFLDFVEDPVTNGNFAYFAVNVFLYQNSNAAIIFRLPSAGVRDILGDEPGLTVLSSGQEIIASTAALNQAVSGPLRIPSQMQSGQGVSVFEDGLIGQPTLSAWTHLPEPFPNWLIAAETTLEEAFLPSTRLRQSLLTIAGIVIAVLALVSIAMARSITSPIKELSTAATRVAQGELNESLPSFRRPMEYRQLSEGVLQMRDSLRDQLAVIEDKNAELEAQLNVINTKNAALEAADRKKDEFLAITSHELRTPLNGIIGIAETLETGSMGELAKAQRSQLSLISFSARRLSRLVDDLLDVYRIREGRLRLDLIDVDIGHSIRNALRLAQPVLLSVPVSVDVEIPADASVVRADPVRLEQILYNLISNAFRHGEHSDVRISSRRISGDDSADCIEITVEDTGPGIDASNLSRIFSPMEQAGEGLGHASDGGGLGLGLTIARNLATLLNGSLSVKSEVGVGSAFSVTLPSSQSGTSQYLESQSFSISKRSTLDTPRNSKDLSSDVAPTILVVDDEPINIQVLKNSLLPQGYEVVEAGNGIDALTQIELARPNLILLDVMMPGISGLDVARDVRSRYSLLDLPIILLTARGRTRDVIAGFEAGANDYVIKPFVKDELLTRIRTLLQASMAKSRTDQNEELKSEIERRIQVEDALRLSQRRMRFMLETLDEGLICAGTDGIISYANSAARRLTGQEIVLGKTKITTVLGSRSELTPFEIDDTQTVSLELVEGPGYLNRFELLPEAGDGYAYLISSRSHESAEFVRSVRDVIDASLEPSVGSGGPVSRPPAFPGAEIRSDQTYRETTVRVMSRALQMWRMLTGRGKIAFAEESGIWRVSLDKTSLQTRTLDKYLLLDTLPSNPRWRDVLRSGEFILSRFEHSKPDLAADDPVISEAANLRSDLEQLRRTLGR